MSDSPTVTPKPQPVVVKPEILLSSPSKPLPSPLKTVWPAPPPSTPVGNWILHQHSFSPKREYFKAYCTGLAKRRVTDHLMWFRFPKSVQHKQVAVHYSRLEWIGGPLAELIAAPSQINPTASLVNDTYESKSGHLDDDKDNHSDVDVMNDIDDNLQHDMHESRDTPKQLEIDNDPDHPYRRAHACELHKCDTPRTFAIVIKFLYCEELHLNYLTFDELVSLANSAHRWQLSDLYYATFSYVMDQNLLGGGLGIRTFLPLVAHIETPEPFRRYFCIAVGHHFDVLYPRLKASEEAGVSGTAQLWKTIFKQNMLSHVVHCISVYSHGVYDKYLLDVILYNYEKEKEVSDEEMLGLLSQLSWDDIDMGKVLSNEGMNRRWSSRAIRLAAIAAYAPQTAALEVRIPWNIPLQRLLKQEVWSFQTEHVPCGPYICYLHVRKGNGHAVSLFVHIWNRDNKPLQDDARHEVVRVKCRATERNCYCDSSKQWSDCSHGFLENLRFEGKLERYPGLGWSQFLEEKRLQEWRNAHGENCGIAITTVLQFVNATRQFEGRFRRKESHGWHGSHGSQGLQSGIHKKRSGNRIKLRESKKEG